MRRRASCEASASDTRPGAAHLALDVGALSSAPRALARLAVWRALERIGGRAIAFDDAEAALAVGNGMTRGGIDLPGQRVEKTRGRLVLTGRPPGSTGRLIRPAPNLFRYSLSIPGEVFVAEAGAVVSAELEPGAVHSPASAVDSASEPAAIVRSDVRRPLAVRSRRPGDRFTPAGRRGRTKLQDYFVDHAIARDRRDRVPIVVDADDRIIWVGGHAVDEGFRAPASATSVLLLRLRFLGGRA